jgi:hypothetical protein
VNIVGLDSELAEVPANATVVLSNFSAPAPVPELGVWTLALAGLGVLALQRRRG